MTITIYTLNFTSDHRLDAPFNVSFNPPGVDSKLTAFIGHPKDRRTSPDTTRQWVVNVPDGAKLEGNKLRWLDGALQRWLTAVEVFGLAKEGLQGFYFNDA